MKIINENGDIYLRYVTKIHKLTSKRELKTGTLENTFYLTTLPDEIKRYLEIEDTIYFHKKDQQVQITKEKPVEDYQKIKVQQTGQFSIPKKFFDPDGFDSVVLLLDVVGRCVVMWLE